MMIKPRDMSQLHQGLRDECAVIAWKANIVRALWSLVTFVPALLYTFARVVLILLFQLCRHLDIINNHTKTYKWHLNLCVQIHDKSKSLIICIYCLDFGEKVDSQRKPSDWCRLDLYVLCNTPCPCIIPVIKCSCFWVTSVGLQFKKTFNQTFTFPPSQVWQTGKSAPAQSDTSTVCTSALLPAPQAWLRYQRGQATYVWLIHFRKMFVVIFAVFFFHTTLRLFFPKGT